MNLFNQKYELDPRPIEEGWPVPGVPSLQQSLHPSSAESKRNARHASLCSAQPVFLQ